MSDKKRERASVGTIPTELRDKFEQFCYQSGFVKGRVLEGALTMFMNLPIEQQIELMRKADGGENE